MSDPKHLSMKDLEDVAQRCADNFGTPDTLMMSPILARMFRLGFGVAGETETITKIRTHFRGISTNPDNNEYKEFDIMSAAARAFGRLGLDKKNIS